MVFSSFPVYFFHYLEESLYFHGKKRNDERLKESARTAPIFNFATSFFALLNARRAFMVVVTTVYNGSFRVASRLALDHFACNFPHHIFCEKKVSEREEKRARKVIPLSSPLLRSLQEKGK